MSVAPAYHESLPYIDPAPSEAALAAARTLIAQESSTSQQSQDSSLLPPSATLSLSPANQASLDHLTTQLPTNPKPSSSAIDLSRYEAQEPPSTSSSHEYLSALSNAYVSASYLASRAHNLQLLEKHGKNAWLIGNHQLEGELKRVEAELAQTKKEIDIVNLERKRRQEEVGGEMGVLEEGWKKGIGRVLETEVAVEELKRHIREELRNQGQAQS